MRPLNAQKSKVYFVKTAEDRYATVFTYFNGLTKKMEAMVTNDVAGVPPAGMPEMDMKTFNLVRNKKINGMQDLSKQKY